MILDTFSPEYIESFASTCFAHGLNPEVTTDLLKRAQHDELYVKDANYRQVFDFTLTKSAAFKALGGFADKALGAGARAAWKGTKAVARNWKPVLGGGLGLGGLGAAGVGGKHVLDMYNKGVDSTNMDIFTPSYMDDGKGGAGAGAATGNNPFDYVNNVNRGGNAWFGGGSSSSSNPSAPASLVGGLKKQLEAITQQESEINKQWEMGRSSSDPKAMLAAHQARRALAQIKAQKNSITRQIDSALSTTRADQSRMHATGGRALETVNKLRPRYMGDLNRFSDLESGGGTWLDRLLYSPEKARAKAEEAASMLSQLNNTADRANKAIGTTLVP